MKKRAKASALVESVNGQPKVLVWSGEHLELPHPGKTNRRYNFVEEWPTADRIVAAALAMYGTKQDKEAALWEAVQAHREFLEKQK